MKGAGAIRLAAAILTLTGADAALPCGHCIEDRVAAVYDYRTELEAEHDHLRIAYLGVNGNRAESAAAAAAVGAALRDAPIAAARTVRTSVSPAAASFAWRGDETELRDALRNVNARLAASGLELELLRTWDARRGLH